jgi:hypothetical protein
MTSQLIVVFQMDHQQKWRSMDSCNCHGVLWNNNFKEETFLWSSLILTSINELLL